MRCILCNEPVVAVETKYGQNENRRWYLCNNRHRFQTQETPVENGATITSDEWRKYQKEKEDYEASSAP